MGAFVAIYKDPDSSFSGGETDIGKAFAKAGFPHVDRLETSRFSIYFSSGNEEQRLFVKAFEGGDFVILQGVLILNGRLDAMALQDVYDGFSGDFRFLTAALGQFALAICKNGLLFITNDRAGVFPIFHTGASGMISSSFLVLAALLPKLTLQKYAVYEYVLNGAITGDETVAKEIRLLPLGSAFRLDQSGVSVEREALDLPISSGRRRAVEETLEHLDGWFATVTSLFLKTSCAMTGGYDSRLVYALLRRHGAVPDLFVYGSGGQDSRIAVMVAEGEALPLQVIDKEGIQRKTPADFPDCAAENFLASDGLFTPGIFNNNAEPLLRRQRHRDGAAFLHGGAGEIFRDFFQLPDGPCPPRDLVKAFFAKFDPRACSGLFDFRDYIDGLTEKVSALTGGGARPLERAAVEWLYPNFRCRAWFGRENSLNSRVGVSLMPFLAKPLTDHAVRIPMDRKKYGRFEAELIARCWPSAATYPSQYGHAFDQPVPLRRRMAETVKTLTPPRFRPVLFMARERWKRRHGMSDPYLGSAYVAAALPDGIVWTRPLFQIERIMDPLQKSRLLTVEYLARWLSGTVRVDWPV